MSRSFNTLAALLAGAAAFAVGGASAQAKTLDVALLGDSYTAGVGGDNYDGSDCKRSPNTWGQVYAGLARTKGHTVNVTNVACGGASVAGLDAQMTAVSLETDLVLVTIGGNDAKFGDIAAWCFMPVVAGPNNCRNAIETGEANITTMRGQLLQRLRTLRTKLRRNAKVVFLTYPYLATPSGYLLKTWFASYDSGTAMRRWGDKVDQATSTVAGIVNIEAGYEFASVVSTKPRFAGHEPDQNPYAENLDHWIHEFTDLPATVDYYHPTAQGYREMAQVAFAAAGPAGDFGVSQ